MKKFLLLAAMAAGTMAASAQTNYVVNGDFETTEGVEHSTPWDWAEETKMLTALPGWDLNLDAWCVLASLVAPEIDDEFTFDGNTQCLHVFRFDDNGWQAGTVSQVVKGLTKGEKYVLGAITALSKGTTVSWDDPYFSISMLPLDDNGEEYGATELFDDRDDAIAESDIWGAYQHEFTAPSTCVRLTIKHNNTKWSGNHSEGFWMDIDDIAIMTPEDYEEYFENKATASIEELNADKEAVVTGVYNINGVRVADSIEALGDASGLFIIATTNGAKKVIR